MTYLAAAFTSLRLPLGSSAGAGLGCFATFGSAGLGFSTTGAFTSLISSLAASTFLLGDLPRVLLGSSLGISVFLGVFGAATGLGASTLGAAGLGSAYALTLLAERAALFAGAGFSTGLGAFLGASFLGGAAFTGELGLFFGNGALELLRGSAGYSGFLEEDLDGCLFLGDGLISCFLDTLGVTSALDTDFLADFLPGDFLGEALRGE